MHTRIISGEYSAGYTLETRYRSLSITATGEIDGSGLEADAPVKVVNAGTLLATYDDPTGPGYAGIDLEGGGRLRNLASGDIGGASGKAGFENDIPGGYGESGFRGGLGVMLGKPGKVLNDGSIVGGQGGVGGADKAKQGLGGMGGGGGYGVELGGTGSIANDARIVGGAGGIGGYGAYIGGLGAGGGEAVRMRADGCTITNIDVLLGGAGGQGGQIGLNGVTGGRGGNGGAGVYSSYAGSVVINRGDLYGGEGGRGGFANQGGGAAGLGGAGGVGVYLRDGGTVVNLGLIAGGDSLAPGYIESGGVYARGEAATTVVNAGTIQGGAISVYFYSENDVLIAEDGGRFIGTVIGGSGALDLAGGKGKIQNLGIGAQLSGSVSGSFSDFGTYEIGAGGQWTMTSAAQLAAGQTLVVAGEAKFVGVLEQDAGAGVTIGAGGMIGFESTSGGALNGAVTNDGVLMTQGAVVQVSGAVAGSGVVVIDGGEVRFLSAFDENVRFKGVSGALDLGRSKGFTASIFGFSANGVQSLDLADVAFTNANEATFSGNAAGGVLTVGAGAHAAHINLKGDYVGDTFTSANDGQGGVLVTATSAVQAGSAHRFIVAMAGHLSGTGGTASLARDNERAAGGFGLAAPHIVLQ